MNKAIGIISFALSVACFAYMFNSDIYISCLWGFGALIVVLLGLFIESRAKLFWSEKFNKLIYYFTRNNKDYIIDSKYYTYICMSNGEYKAEKKFNIYPTCDNLDRISERFVWSGSSGKYLISPVNQDHIITSIHQEELWTCYTVYFNSNCKKHEIFSTGSIVSNLIDVNNTASPFISTRVTRKTKQLVMKVCFDGVTPPNKARLKVVDIKNPSQEIFSEDLVYDDVIKGFTKSINYPRQKWKYIITW